MCLGCGLEYESWHRPATPTGYGSQSRFLTSEGEALCDRVDVTIDAQVWTSDAVLGAETVTVDLADLWR